MKRWLRLGKRGRNELRQAPAGTFRTLAADPQGTDRPGNGDAAKETFGNKFAVST